MDTLPPPSNKFEGRQQLELLYVPERILLEDLQEQIATWQSEGDQVIILADMNEDV